MTIDQSTGYETELSRGVLDTARIIKDRNAGLNPPARRGELKISRTFALACTLARSGEASSFLTFSS